MNRRSLALGLYVTTRPGGSGIIDAKNWPERPDGPVIWFHCRDIGDYENARAIIRQSNETRDDVSYVLTGSGQPDSTNSDGTIITLSGPGRTPLDIKSFAQHFQPNALIWVGGAIDPLILTATDKLVPKRYLICANSNEIEPPNKRWLWGMRRALISRFDAVFATDAASMAKFAKWGATESKTIGSFEEDSPLLPYNDAEYRDVIDTLDTRPVWMAVDAVLPEIKTVIAAHKNACKRSHRLLLIVVPRNESDAPAIAQTRSAAGIETIQRSDSDPTETTRAIVADMSGELGMWYRVAPITYFGGTLTRSSRHPFEAASLGSVVVHGPMTAPYSRSYDKLDAAGGAYAIRNPNDLATAIEALLSPDRAAKYAHAAWAVTSSGAEVTNRVADLIDEITQ